MRTIKKWVLATFILTFLVIIAGGVVRTTQSGMGCPDWPKCFGLWIPPTDASQLPPDFEKYLKAQDIDHTFNAFHTWIEYINRLLGALLGVFALIQTALLFNRRKVETQSYKISVAFLILVILTGLLGAIVVKFNLAHVSISIHLLFAIALIQIQLALLLATTKKIFKKTAGTKVRRLLFFLLIIILIQSVFGTTVRMYVDDISKSLDYKQRSAWLANMPWIFKLHRSFSWIVLASVLYAAWASRKVPVLKKHFQRLIFIILCSATAGIVLYYLDFPKEVQPLHLLLASLAITQTMFMLLYTKNTTDLLKPQKL
jgi:heme a synthase